MAKNITYWKCTQCKQDGTHSIVEWLPQISPEFEDKTTKEKPKKRLCRKCYLDNEYLRVTGEKRR